MNAGTKAMSVAVLVALGLALAARTAEPVKSEPAKAEPQKGKDALSFNTAGLPDAATIVSAKLTLRLYGVSGFNPFFTLSKIWIHIKIPAFGTSPLLQITDFNAATSRNNVGSIANKGAAGYYSSQLSSDAFPYINKTGLTQLRLRYEKVDMNTGEVQGTTPLLPIWPKPTPLMPPTARMPITTST